MLKTLKFLDTLFFLGLYDEWKVHLNYSTGMLKDRMLKKSLELNLSLWQM